MSDLCPCGSRTRRLFIAVVFTTDGVQHPVRPVQAFCADHANDMAQSAHWQDRPDDDVQHIDVVDVGQATVELAALGALFQSDVVH